MQPKNDFVIRTMNHLELELAVNFAKNEGWNPGIDDAECFYHTDPEGFLVGTLDNRPVSFVSAVSYGGKFGFIGFYIVEPELRGREYGILMGLAALKRLEGQNTGIDGVLEKESVYEMFGFKKAYRNIRYEHFPLSKDAAVLPEMKKLTEAGPEILQYDRRCFPAERQVFLQYWLKQPHSFALGFVENGRIKGYGVIRRCFTGYKIGPLFADDASIAESLYFGLTAKTEKGSPVYLDVPEVNSGAVKLAEKYNMKEVFATARMYSKGQPDIALDKVFGVTSFELG
ncbi:MAG: hypothetical protein JXA46_18665 [Dehalococcoidales bacterium]|nr:hypothetical protein [Dehalococcoidales bacterium]